MNLTNILNNVTTKFTISSNLNLVAKVNIDDIASDSRLVKKDSVFFALSGAKNRGADFISEAINKESSVVVAAFAEEKIDIQNFVKNSPNVVFIDVAKPSDVFELLVEFLNSFYQPLPNNIYAITGTNGKTSSVEFTRQILQFLGKKSASIGTLGVLCDEEIKPHLSSFSLTTPTIVDLYKNLHILKKFGVDDVAIEVSSIGLEQRRIAGLKIDVAAFTNFTQDHLDYHHSMENYFACKMILFKSVVATDGAAVLNSDIPEYLSIKKICAQRNLRVIDYGFKAKDLKIEAIANQCVKFSFRKNLYEFELSASGDFQAFNAVCALGNVLAKNNLSEQELKNLLKDFSKITSAVGRMQKVAQLKNQAQIFIDFAHSPDALQNVLQLARNLTTARVVVLFGCGGDRDAKKRPLMGEVACKFADLVIVTDDNPRTENPQKIRQEILAKCDLKKTYEIFDRKAAIEKAVILLQDRDVLILAGKGHEKYQIIGETKFEFDEEKITKNVISRIFQS